MSLRISSKFLTDDQLSVLLDKVRTDCERNRIANKALEDHYTVLKDGHNMFQAHIDCCMMEHLLSELCGKSEEVNSTLKKWMLTLEKEENFFIGTPVPFTETKAFWDSLP